MFQVGNYVEREETSPDPITLRDECSNGRFSITYLIDNISQENVSLICESSPPEGWCREVTDQFLENYIESGTYVFKVLE
jgi:uncharacterized Fe-S cluster-containing protein